jgi:hypothetical protein
MSETGPISQVTNQASQIAKERRRSATERLAGSRESMRSEDG